MPLTIYLCTKQQNYCLAQKLPHTHTHTRWSNPYPPSPPLPYIMHVNINTKRFLKGNPPFHICAGRTQFFLHACWGLLVSTLRPMSNAD